MHDLEHDDGVMPSVTARADSGAAPPATTATATPTSASVSAPAPAPARTVPAETRWLCGELARQARDFYPDRDWAGVESILQRIWTREPRGIDWPTAAPMIRAAWTVR